MDTSACNAEQKQAVEAVQAEAREAVEAAESREEVEAILAEARKALQDAMNLVCASEMFEDVALMPGITKAWTTWCAENTWKA